jgi:hypothetical protein
MKRIHIVFSLVVLTGCAGLIGVPDLSFDENAASGHSDGGSQNDGSAHDGDTSPHPGTDGGTGTCDTSKVATDPHNCGRCGHDCLGGTCSAGKCASVVVQGGLSNPDDLAIDANNVYVTSRENGVVLRIAKQGGLSTVLANNQIEARGVAVNGSTLFWSNGYFEGDGGGDDHYNGGVWSCPLPDCATKTLVTTGSYAMNVRFSNGVLFFAENNNSSVVRVNPDGTARSSLSSPNQPFSLAVDDTHVYYQAGSGLNRIPISGGTADESVDDEVINSERWGFVAVDGERVYWAFTGTNGQGLVKSAFKASLDGPKEIYGDSNKGSCGVAIDETTLYWTNSGTWQDQANDYANNHDGSVLACPKAGCGGKPPVTLESGLLYPYSIAVDGDAIYFLTFGTKFGSTDGELRRIAKP